MSLLNTVLESWFDRDDTGVYTPKSNYRITYGVTRMPVIRMVLFPSDTLIEVEVDPGEFDDMLFTGPLDDEIIGNFTVSREEVVFKGEYTE